MCILEAELGNRMEEILSSLRALFTLSVQPTSSQRKLVMELLDSLHIEINHHSLPSGALDFDQIAFLLVRSFESKCRGILIRGMGILSSLALTSLETNLKIVSHIEVLQALLNLVSKDDTKLCIAACNAMTDIAITVEGRNALCDLNTMESLLSLLSWAAGSICKDPESMTTNEPASGDTARVQELLRSALDVAGALLQNHQLKKTKKAIVHSAFTSLRNLWQLLFNIQRTGDYKSEFQRCLMEEHLLARIIVMLASEHHLFYDLEVSVVAMEQMFLGGSVASFINSNWESLPLLSVGSVKDDILMHLKKEFSMNVDSLLTNLIEGSVTCPLAPADEIDIELLLDEIKSNLGDPILYGKDICVVRSVETQFSSVGDMKCCVEKEFQPLTSWKAIDYLTAFHNGYTIAIRGMEFRSPVIAAISNHLAQRFGQASVGANLYLTPCGSQGFATHYDDHCVFALQVAGQKTWKVYPQEHLLPRLYGQRDSPKGSTFTLVKAQPGNVLYIPRGFPHAAHTFVKAENDEHTSSAPGFEIRRYNSHQGTSCLRKRNRDISIENIAGVHSSKQLETKETYSLHVTFGVAIEPPFDWEGLMHIALHNWMQWKEPEISEEFAHVAADIKLICGIMLHISIRKVGDQCAFFRKACLLGASELINGTDEKGMMPEVLFSRMVNSFLASDYFMEVFEMVRSLDSENKLSFWIGWLRHISTSDDYLVSDNHLYYINCILGLERKGVNKTVMETIFQKMKATFCLEVNFHDACHSFKNLLYKYQGVRRKLVNGILALHNVQCKAFLL